MFKSVIAWFSCILHKDVCTADQLSHACTEACEYAKKDKDGVITVKEALTCLLMILRNLNKYP